MHDVIIVGAGIAGSVLAEKLKKLDVLVIEKRHGFKKDSGIVATKHIGKTIPKKFVRHEISAMSLVSPCGRTIDIHTQKPFAFALERKEFEKHLRSRIKKTVVYDCVKEIMWEEDFVQVVGEKDRYYGKLVIGCDGACSAVRTAMRLQDGIIEDRNMIYGVIGSHKIEQDNIHVYFNKLFSKDFFSWTIPQNNEYGLMTASNPLGGCKCFGRKMGFGNIIHEQQSCETRDNPTIGKIIDLRNKSAIITKSQSELAIGKLTKSSDLAISITPMTIGIKKSYSDMALLVGESAGQVKPITGGGIDLAISCACHAANTIKRSAKENNTGSNFLRSYEHSWKSEFEKEIEKQMWLRKIYSRLNNQQIDELFKIARNTKIDEIDDYVGLSSLMKKIPKMGLFLWALWNVRTFLK
ncbi:MAG: NAD(P)/FAD-dependent oxidoreductase [Candidatus Aenigmarchaeota archaeon]|nr:NAD(P)/FAD-dependent oxidoreductase [Candidatus Aenigmarchaeota archaeon]